MTRSTVSFCALDSRTAMVPILSRLKGRSRRARPPLAASNNVALREGFRPPIIRGSRFDPRVRQEKISKNNGRNLSPIVRQLKSPDPRREGSDRRRSGRRGIKRNRHRNKPFAGQREKPETSPVPQRRPSFGELDLDVGIFERRAVERMDRLVDGLLGGENEAPRDAVAIGLRAAPRRSGRDSTTIAPAAVRPARRRRRGRASRPRGARPRRAKASSCASEPTIPSGHRRRAGGRARQRRAARRRRGRRARRARRCGRRRSRAVAQDGRRRRRPGSAKAASSPGRMRRASNATPNGSNAARSGAQVEVVAPRACIVPRVSAAARRRWTSLAGLPRQREPAGVISPFIRKASASRRVPSFMSRRSARARRRRPTRRRRSARCPT